MHSRYGRILLAAPFLVCTCCAELGVRLSDYFCGGRLYVTPNYVLYIPKIGSSKLSIPIREVSELRRERSLFSSSITLLTRAGNEVCV